LLIFIFTISIKFSIIQNIIPIQQECRVHFFMCERLATIYKIKRFWLGIKNIILTRLLTYWHLRVHYWPSWINKIIGNRSFAKIFLYFITSKNALKLLYHEYLILYQNFKIVQFWRYFFWKLLTVLFYPKSLFNGLNMGLMFFSI